MNGTLLIISSVFIMKILHGVKKRNQRYGRTILAQSFILLCQQRIMLNSLRTWWIHSLILPPIPKRRGGECILEIPKHFLDYDIDSELWHKYREFTTVELLEKYDASFENDDDGQILNKGDYRDIPKYLASQFRLMPSNTTSEILSDIFADMSKRVDELEKIVKNHRHNMDKRYSEKPAW